MSFLKKFLMLCGILLIILAVSVIIFHSSLFKYGLEVAFDRLRETGGILVSFEDASLSLGGAVSIEKVNVTDMASYQQFLDVKKIDAHVDLLSVFSSPISINALDIQDPVFTYFPGIVEVFSKPNIATISGVNREKLSNPEIDTEESVAVGSSMREVRIRNGKVKNGTIRYLPEGSADPITLAAVNASVKDLSQAEPFAFDLGIDMAGESKGSIAFKGTVNPENFDTDISLVLTSVEFPLEKKSWPRTDGNLTLVLQNKMSKILSSGNINMAAPPPYIPQDIAAGGPFSVNWKVDSNIEEKGAGRIDLRSMDLAVHGLKGGPQGLSGSGSYDPKTAQGNFQVSGKDISAPLLNAFVEPSLKMSLRSGKAGVEARLARNGASEPFAGDINLTLSGINFADLAGKRPDLKFNNVAIIAKGSYSPEQDDLNLQSLNTTLDDINLSVNGKINALKDPARRSVNLNIRNDNFDLARMIPLVMPELQAKATLTGNAGVNVNITGQTASQKFPVINGSANLLGVTYIPREDPSKKIMAKGTIQFDPDNLAGQDLDIKLGEVPGKLTFKMTRYNEPVKGLTAKFAGLAIEPLVNAYKPDAAGLLLGNISGDAAMTLDQKNTPQGLVFNYVIQDGVMLTRHPVPAAIVNIVGWEWLKSGFKLTDARGKIIQDEKGYRLEPLLFMGAKGGFAIKGRIGYDNKLTANARLNVAKDAIGELPKTLQPLMKSPKSDSKFSFLDIPMGGTVQRPVPKLDLKNAVGAGINILQDKLQDKLGDQLKGKIPENISSQIGDKIPISTEGGAGQLMEGVSNILGGKKSSTQSQSTQKATQPDSAQQAAPPAQESGVEQKKSSEQQVIEDVGGLLQGFMKKKEKK